MPIDIYRPTRAALIVVEVLRLRIQSDDLPGQSPNRCSMDQALARLFGMVIVAAMGIFPPESLIA